MLCALAAGGTSDKGYVDNPVCCVYGRLLFLLNVDKPTCRRADSCFASIVIVLQNKTDPNAKRNCLLPGHKLATGGCAGWRVIGLEILYMTSGSRCLVLPIVQFCLYGSRFSLSTHGDDWLESP